MISDKRFILLSILLCFFAAGPLDVWSATDEGLDEIQCVRVELNEIDLLVDAVDTLREWNRDGFNTRIDSRALRVLTRLNRLARRLLASRQIDDGIRRTLEDLLDDALALSVQREKLLEARAAEERAKVPKFENSAQAKIPE